jgi:hypothetical protein
MTNEDAIDLYNHVKVGTPVVVLPPHGGLFSPRMAGGGGSSSSNY